MTRRYLAALLGVQLTAPAMALEPLTDAAMAAVAGRDGISLVLENISLTGDHTVSYRPSGNGDLLELHNITVGDGAGGGANVGSQGNPLRLDLDGALGLTLAFPAGDDSGSDLHLAVGALVVNGYSVGALSLAGLSLADTVLNVRGHGDGLSLGLALGLGVDQLSLIAPGPGGVTFSGLYIGSEPGANSDPRFPHGGTDSRGNSYQPWAVSGGWQLADVNGYPLKFDVATCTRNCSGDAERIYISFDTNLATAPKGYVRIADIAFPETPNFHNQLNPGQAVSLGSSAVEGLQVTRLSILVPGG